MASASSWMAARTTSSTRAVVAQVNHLATLRLDQAAHDVDGRVVAVKQAGSGDKTQRRFEGGVVFHAQIGCGSAHRSG